MNESLHSPHHAQTDSTTQNVVLAGGCFWCLEAVYEQVCGVERVISGYANGHTQNPSYREVCSGDTGHAEVVKIEFDPQKVSLQQLLEVFFVIHDPTTLNRQGHDVGTQYRSGIYWQNDEQKQAAQTIIQELKDSKAYVQPIVTEVEALDHFWPAEEEHQHYFARNPFQGYCAHVVAPKVDKFMKTFKQLVRQDTRQLNSA